MRITVWIAKMERETWVTAAEILGLALIVIAAPVAVIRVLLGVPLLAHLGYRALTSLPMGLVPRRPERGQPRQRYDLRARVVRFLDEVRRAEDLAERSRVGGPADSDMEQQMWAAQKRVMAAAAEVAKATGRSGKPGPMSGEPLSQAF
jgi:hypothetical protein